MIKPKPAPPVINAAPTITAEPPASGLRPHALPPTQFPRLTYSSLSRLPPGAGLSRPAQDKSGGLPLRVGFVVNTFSFGGSETETIELVRGANPELLQFTGIAVARPLPLPDGEPPKDGSFPPIYQPPNPYVDPLDPRVRIVRDFRDAISNVATGADLLISWGQADLASYLPKRKIPKLVIQSKDSGIWARGFLHPNSLATRHCVANSTLAASAFPEPIHKRITVLHDGINPRRVAPIISRAEQRRLWDLTVDDRVVGYLGRIERDKGVSKTVEGLAQLPEAWKVVFIGVNPNSAYSGELARHCALRIPGRYRLFGWCHDIGSALAACDVFCHPSDHEGFSNSLGEAWLAGVPTVYTAGTGCVPDLGDLGIPVSADACGAEIAQAVLRAFGNAEVVTRARNTIMRGFLTTHYVQRWTEYLLQIHLQADKTRVLLLFPGDLTARVPEWLSSIAAPPADFDPCCLAVERGNNPLPAELETNIYSAYQCPTFYVSRTSEISKLITYTRPDVVLTFPGSMASHLRPDEAQVPVLVAPPGVGESGRSWIAWLNHLAHLGPQNALKEGPRTSQS